MIRCPECEEQDVTVVRLTPALVRLIEPVDLSGGQEVELSDGEQELLEVEHDCAEFQCELCCHTTDDPDDFRA